MILQAVSRRRTRCPGFPAVSLAEYRKEGKICECDISHAENPRVLCSSCDGPHCRFRFGEGDIAVTSSAPPADATQAGYATIRSLSRTSSTPPYSSANAIGATPLYQSSDNQQQDSGYCSSTSSSSAYLLTNLNGSFGTSDVSHGWHGSFSTSTPAGGVPFYGKCDAKCMRDRRGSSLTEHFRYWEVKTSNR